MEMAQKVTNLPFGFDQLAPHEGQVGFEGQVGRHTHGESLLTIYFICIFSAENQLAPLTTGTGASWSVRGASW